MARRGAFGRLPRTAPSLSSTIIAIAREMQAQRDSNIMDAWKSGGTFEGKKATDGAVLAYWKARVGGVAKDDPLYDLYHNNVTQLEYTIAESKASTSYAQGKMSDKAMAGFYTNWARKVPKDSEFYRVLMRDAAQFMRASKAKSQADINRLKEERYQRDQVATENQYEKAGQYVGDVLKRIAQANGLIGMSDDASLLNFDPRDPEKMMRLFTILSATESSSTLAGQVGTVLYHDDKGNPVTAGDVVAHLRSVDPTFDGRITMDYLSKTLTSQRTGIEKRLALAEKTGHATDANNLRGWKTYITEVARETNAWPVAQTYSSYRQDFLGVWESTSATPAEKLEAWKVYQGQLMSLRDDPRIATDDATKNKLVAEATGDASSETLSESFTGLNNADNSTTSSGFKGDIAETQVDVAKFQSWSDAVNTPGSGVFWTQGVEDSAGNFKVKPGGPMVGAATYDQIANVSPVTPVPVVVPQGNGATPMTMLVTGVNVDAYANDPLTGQPVERSTKNPVCTAYDITIGGFVSRVYSFKGSDGKTYYSTEAPWGDGVPAHTDESGIHVDLTGMVPTKNENGQYAYADGSAVTFGQGGMGLSEPDRDGNQHLVIDPRALTYATDPSRVAAGPNPTTDFFSPTLAALMSSPEGVQTLNKIKDTPAFKTQMDYDSHVAAGFSRDAKTGAWFGGDEGLLQKYTGVVTSATHIPEAPNGQTSFILDGYKLWNRFSTAGTFDTSSKEAPSGPTSLPGRASLNQAIATNIDTLPSDQARGTAFDALAQGWQNGSNLLKSAAPGAGGLEIKTPTALKVPQVNLVDFITKAAATVKPDTSGVNTNPYGSTITTNQAPSTTQKPPHTGANVTQAPKVS